MKRLTPKWCFCEGFVCRELLVESEAVEIQISQDATQDVWGLLGKDRCPE